MKKMRPEVKRILLLLQSGGAMALCLALLVTCFYTKAWFSENTKVTAGGMQVVIQSQGDIIVKQSGNELRPETDSLEFVESKMNETDGNGNYYKIQPGSSGSIKFTVTSTASKKVRITAQALSDYLMKPSETDKSVIIKYLTTHIAFFLVVDGMKTWIPPDGISVDASSETAVEIYWEWLNSYDIYPDIEKSIKAAVTGTDTEYLNRWFDGANLPYDTMGTKEFSDAYNRADTAIGSALSANPTVYFSLGFSPDNS